MSEQCVKWSSGATVSRRLTFPGRIAFDPVSHANIDQYICSTHINPVSAAEWICRPEWKVASRVVRDDMWFCVESGKGFCGTGDRGGVVEIGPGALFLVPRGVRHSVYCADGEEMRLFTVHFFARLYGVTSLLDSLKVNGVYEKDHGLDYVARSRELAAEYASREPGWLAVMEAGIRTVLCVLCRVTIARSGMQSRSAPGLARLAPVISEIERRLDDPSLKVRDLARVACVSEVYLRKLFRKELDASPTGFIRQRRIDRACALLRTSSLSIKEIGFRCGFSDTPFFYRTFVRKVGQPPGRYRRVAEFT